MIKLSKYDKLFSNHIRSRDKWRCQRCGKKFEPPTNGLHCAHFHGRGKKSTRFVEDNAVALCYGCHSYFDGAGRMEFVAFMENRLGKKKFKELNAKAQLVKKERDAVEEFMEWYKQHDNKI